MNQELGRTYKTIDIKLKKLVHMQTKNPDYQVHFYPRVINKTDITFTKDELSHLKKGLKYNLNFKHKNWIKTLAPEAETAITQLPIFEQDYLRYQFAQDIKQLYKQHKDKHTYNTIHMKETINKIKDILTTNKALISKANKGNSIIITYQDEYHKATSLRNFRENLEAISMNAK